MVSLNHQFVTDEHGKKTAILVPISEYEQLVEDLEDMTAVLERRDEPTIPHEKVTELIERYRGVQD